MRSGKGPLRTGAWAPRWAAVGRAGGRVWKGCSRDCRAEPTPPVGVASLPPAPQGSAGGLSTQAAACRPWSAPRALLPCKVTLERAPAPDGFSGTTREQLGFGTPGVAGIPSGGRAGLLKQHRGGCPARTVRPGPWGPGGASLSLEQGLTAGRTYVLGTDGRAVGSISLCGSHSLSPNGSSGDSCNKGARSCPA